MELLFSIYILGVLVVASYYGIQGNWYNAIDRGFALQWPIILFFKLNSKIARGIEEILEK